MNPPTIIELGKQCRACWNAAAADLGNDLRGCSVLDLCADNVTDASLFDLKCAIISAAIYNDASPRLQKEIAAYR